MIQQAGLASGATRPIKSVADLTFSQYVSILEKPENWQQLGLSFDRKTVVQNLREVNAARNDVMHFRPIELDSQSTEAIDRCLNWLRAIRSR